MTAVCLDPGNVNTGMLRAGWPDALVYLCMESRSVWDASLGWSPTSAQLATVLDERVTVR